MGDTRVYSDVGFVMENSGDRSSSRNMYRAFQSMREMLVYLGLGLNFVDYLRYSSVVKHLGITVEVYDDGTHRFYKRNKNLVDAATAEYLATYGIDTVIQIESRAGDLYKPFKP